MRAIALLALGATLGSLAAPAWAQEVPNSSADDANSAGAPAWRNLPLLPPGSPSQKECAKHGCIYIVNLSGHSVTGLRFAVTTDKKGSLHWSGNQFGPTFEFKDNRFMRWLKPGGMGCWLALSVDVEVDGKAIEENGSFDACSSPSLLFYVRDPSGLKRGTVTVEPNPGSAGPSPAQPPAPAPLPTPSPKP